MAIRFLPILLCVTLIAQLPFALSLAQPINPSELKTQSLAVPHADHPKLVRSLGSTEDAVIHRMLQDKAGNLWFATSGEGVYRFDGTQFKQYTKKDGLNSNRICSILEDIEGRIWFGTDVGICRFDGKTIAEIPITGANGRLYFPPLVASGNSPAAKNEVWSIMQDKSGMLWFGTSGGLYRFNGTIFSRLLDNFQVINEEGLKLLKIQCMMQDSKGIIWLGSGLGEVEGLCLYDGKRVTSIKPKPDRWIRSILEDNQGTFWISTRIQGVWRDQGDGYKRFPQDENIAKLLQDNLAILQDRAGNIWFSGSEELQSNKSHSGVWRFDGTEFRNYNSNDGLGSFCVFCMLEDRDGNIWFGTRNTGLYRFDGTKFTSFSE